MATFAISRSSNDVEEDDESTVSWGSEKAALAVDDKKVLKAEIFPQRNISVIDFDDSDNQSFGSDSVLRTMEKGVSDIPDASANSFIGPDGLPAGKQTPNHRRSILIDSDYSWAPFQI